ncbi:HAD family hydrolase [Amycolatopsis sp. lyj-90]|uniref:HAD family hydrolase n=1 Tax=Amycolatopsis sp. lyj-90 TaxID=2789285 RepID=UPI00397D1BF8
MTADSADRAKHAFLDMDGTLLPGVLGMHYLRDLAADGVCDRALIEACMDAVKRHTASAMDREHLHSEPYRLYAEAIRGASSDQARATATRTWNACRRQLFPFVGELISLLKVNGYRIHLISGNADTIMTAAALGLGVASGHGVGTEISGGRFTGRLTGPPGLPGGKDSIIRELKATEPFDHDRAVAIGNTIRDAELFDHVGIAVAFEPDGELRPVAVRRGWHIVDRGTIVPACARLLAGSSSARTKEYLP